MSKEVKNQTETHNKTVMLVILLTSISLLSGALSNIYGDLWNENVEIILRSIQILFSLLIIWFCYRIMKSSNIIRKDRRLMSQLRDERNIEIDYKSRANGYLGCIIFAAVYLIIATILKVLFKNKFLFEIDGFYIALLVIAVGGIVTFVSQFSMDKE